MKRSLSLPYSPDIDYPEYANKGQMTITLITGANKGL